MSYEILVLDAFDENSVNQMKKTAQQFGHKLQCCWPLKDEERRKEAIKRANIIIGQPKIEEISKENAPHLLWIQMTWAGADVYTLEKEKFPSNVLLTNATGAFGPCIAEYMVGAILNQYRGFGIYYDQQKQRLWKKQQGVRSLEGQTILVVGAGDIGTQFAKRMKNFDCWVIGIKRTVEEKPDYFDEMYTIEQLDNVLPKADIVACSLPNTQNTRGLFQRSRLLQMKKGSLFLNVGRGTVVSLEDLITVLQDGHLEGAILDVTNPEPLPLDHPIWNQERVMITPHISGQSFGQSKKTEERITNICCENIKRYCQGEVLKNIVDLQEGYVVQKI